jgi:uncharacterized membrane-anchored protein
MTANTLKLGYYSSGLMFACLIIVPAAGCRWFGLNAVAAFWAAYVLTRPLGASFADWFGVSKARGGLDLGPGPVSVILGALIVAFVVYLVRTRSDAPAAAAR